MMNKYAANIRKTTSKLSDLNSHLAETKITTNPSKSIASAIKQKTGENMLQIAKRELSRDEMTIKYLWRLEDRQTVESVYLCFPAYDSLCISSQVGCNLKCAFCATGLKGLMRNLSSNEIIGQVESVFEDIGMPKRDFKIAFMGMGEPLLNLDAVLNAYKYLKFKYPGIRFSASTVGIVPGIYVLTEKQVDIQLQVSLHAPNDNLRATIMPITKKYPIKDVLKAGKHYALVSGKKLRVSYLLLNGINDSLACAEELVALLRELPVYLKISKFNPLSKTRFSVSTDEQLKSFELKCLEGGLLVHRFSSMGIDIEGGCGQLRSREIN